MKQSTVASAGPSTNDVDIDDLAGRMATAFQEALDDSVFLHKLLFNHLIHEVMFAYMTPLELMRVARTCRLAHTTVHDFIKRTFKINRFLLRFFTDPLAFRSLQARTRTLISGSSALQFLDRTFYPESDLDLYIPSVEVDEVVTWLLGQGYKYVADEEQSDDWKKAVVMGAESFFMADGVDDPDADYSDRTIQVVLTLVKPSPTPNGRDLKVQCIVARQSPIEVILNFHSTCVLNVISYANAYCLYPRATLHDRRTLICTLIRTASRHEALRKYMFRGFKVVRRISPDASGQDPRFPLCSRYMGDPLCWTVPLDTEGVDIEAPNSGTELTLRHDPVGAASWQMKVRTLPYYDIEMESQSFGCEFLRFHYPVSSVTLIKYGLQLVRAQVHKQREGLDVPRFIDDLFIDQCLEYYKQHWPF